MAYPPPRLTRALRARFAKALLLLAVAVPLLLVLARSRHRDAKPTFAAETTSKLGELIVGGRSKNVTFWDGSRLLLKPSARMRVTALSEERAEVRLESGELEARLVHTEGRDWVISAGPFVLYASGARFRISSTNDNEELTIDFESGFAKVLSACAGGAMVFDEPRRERLTCSTKAEAPTLAVPTAAATNGDPTSHHAGHEHPEATPPPTEPEGDVEQWQRLARDSEYAAAYAALEQQEFREACAKWPAPRLLEAADLCAVARKPSEAERYLRCVMERFASERELGAAFMRLGKLHFDKDAEKAAQWYLRYETEFSDGPVLAEALGRALLSLSKAGDRPRARQVAERYLTRFPKGPYAPLAEAVRQ